MSKIWHDLWKKLRLEPIIFLNGKTGKWESHNHSYNWCFNWLKLERNISSLGPEGIKLPLKHWFVMYVKKMFLRHPQMNLEPSKMQWIMAEGLHSSEMYIMSSILQKDEAFGAYNAYMLAPKLTGSFGKSFIPRARQPQSSSGIRDFTHTLWAVISCNYLLYSSCTSSTTCQTDHKLTS